jgi:2',3'-cyclic-nucleotide 2'-phosphodiesterase (5'-nucleotidase family)
MLDISRAEMVFINGGGIRESIQKGRIKIIDVLNVLPFNNTITTLDLPGSVVLAILKKSASLGNNAGGLVHVSRGLKYTIKGKTLGSVTFKGQPIDPARLYRVATSNFMAAGGDGYSEFKQGKRPYDLGITMSDAVQKRIMADKTVTVTTDGRLTRE